MGHTGTSRREGRPESEFPLNKGSLPDPFSAKKTSLLSGLLQLSGIRGILLILLTGILIQGALPVEHPNREDKHEKVRPMNVLLIISDDLNTRIGPYMDLDRHTPNLDELARQGIRFTRAYCQYPLCGPSRASLMSGLYAETNGELRNNDHPGSFRQHNPALATHPSLAGFFREQGYFTARVSKIYHMGVPGGIERGEPGGDEPDSWDYAYNVMGPETLSRGELELLSPGNLHYGSNFARMILPDDRAHTQTDYLAVSQAIAILESRASQLAPGATNKKRIKPDAPFFLGVGLVRPHVPLIAPASCFEPYPQEDMLLPAIHIGSNVPEDAYRRNNDAVWKMNETQQRKTISSYMASVRFMDRQVGRLLDALDQLGLRENTIVVFMSDHGYNLGEHNCWSKGALWEGMTRVPLIISHPEAGASQGQSCTRITELIDLYPTLSALCGLSGRQPDRLQGRDLSRIVLEGNGAAGPGQAGDSLAYTTTSAGKASSIRSPRWRYTRWGEQALRGREELYDHQNDPEEFYNLATKPEYLEVLESMRTAYDRKRETARNQQQ